jgi:hypothetical protein
LLATLVLGIAAVGVSAQTPPAQDRTSALRVFLDCDFCDENYLRTEITFINYMRDRTDADVHVLVTAEGTGGGGRTHTLKFIGLGRFKGIDQTLTYTAPQTNTDDETRRGLASTLKLGLVRYAAETPLASRLKITYDAPAKLVSAEAVRDPWHFWVFNMHFGGNVDGSRAEKSQSIRGSFSATRTTDKWKVNLNGNGGYSENKFELDEDETFTSISRNLNASALVARSLTQHWSIGAVSQASSSTFLNHRFRTRLGPGIEYSVFPYSESTRRLLTIFYTVGYHHFNYREETIFSKLKESLLDHRLEATLALRQPWGSAEAGTEFAQYLSDASKYRIAAFGEIDVRLFRGFSVDTFASVSKRRDQIYLPKEGATSEEILVRQRELATGYQYEVGFGISYSFGSIYNNVVNPRFRNAGGF